MIKITYWHRFAQTFMNGELTMPEIAKIWIISTAMGVIEDEKDVTKVGINVLNNSVLNGALVLGIISGFDKHYSPEQKLLSYPDIGRMLNIHPQTVGVAVKRLVAEGIIDKEDFPALGTKYTVHKDKIPKLPNWVLCFTQAIVELETDPELKEEVVKQCIKIEFRRGMQVLKKELREKFYPHKKE